MTTDPRTGCLPNLAALIIGPALFCAGIIFSELWLSPHVSTDDLQQDIIQIREELAQLKQHQPPSTEITRESLARRPGEDSKDWIVRLKRESPYLAEPPQPTPKEQDVFEEMMRNIRRRMEEGQKEDDDQPPSNEVVTLEDLERRTGEDLNDWVVRLKRQSLHCSNQLSPENTLDLVERMMRDLEEAERQRAK